MQIKYFVLVACLFFTLPGMAQQNAAGTQPGQNHSVNMPKADYDTQAFLAKNLKYPADAKAKKIEGRVIVKFTVDADGKISNAKVERGIGGGCDEEALRVVSMMPKWIPGHNDGQPMHASYSIPVVFKL